MTDDASRERLALRTLHAAAAISWGNAVAGSAAGSTAGNLAPV